MSFLIKIDRSNFHLPHFNGEGGFYLKLEIEDDN